MDINKNDLDSLQKYVPNFYEEYNLKLAKPFLPKEKNGGILKKPKQLSTFTNGWVDKYM
jgi:hypothetical protein